MLNRLFIVVVFLMLAVSIAYYVIPNFNNDVVVVLARLEWLWLFCMLVAVVVHYLSETGRWWFYLRADSNRPASLLRKLFAIFSLTAFLTYLLPFKLGVPLRLYLLTRELSLSAKQATALLTIDGVLSYGMWILITLLLYGLLPQSILPGGLSVYIYICILGVVMVAGWLIVQRKTPQRWRSILQPLPISAISGIVIILAVDIAFYVLRHWAILQSFDTELRLYEIAFATVASITAGFLSMLPMGIGAYDVTLVFLLSAFGVPMEVAVLVPLINRAANILISVLLGLPASYATGISLLTLRRNVKTN